VNEGFGSLESCPALVLNADYQPLSYLPLSLWPWQEVMKAVILDRVRVIATYEGVNIRAPQRLFALPSVVCLKEYKAIHGARPAFSRVSQRLFRTFDILPPSHIPSLTHPLSLNFRKKVQCFSPGRVSLPVLWLESNLEAVNIRPRRTPSPRWKVQLGKHCIGL